VSPVRYELDFYIPEDDILHSHCHENLRSYVVICNFMLPDGRSRVRFLWLKTGT
jgi:hypothetical protein